MRGEGSRGGWRHKEGEYGFWGDSDSESSREEILGEALEELGNSEFTVHTVAERFGHGGLGHP